MLNNVSDIKNEFLVRNQTSTAIAFYTDTILNDWLREATQWSASYKKWPFTEGRVSTTYASLVTSEDGDLVGEYPEGWRSDSIRILQIGGKRLQKLNFEDYQIFREESPDSADRVYSDFSRRFYVNPQTDLGGSVVMWGQYTPNVDATDETAITVFSNNEEEGNYAVVEEMMSYARIREKKVQESLVHHQKAMQILDGIWQRIKDEQFGYQTHRDRGGIFKQINVLDGAIEDEMFHRDRWY